MHTRGTRLEARADFLATKPETALALLDQAREQRQHHLKDAVPLHGRPSSRHRAAANPIGQPPSGSPGCMPGVCGLDPPKRPAGSLGDAVGPLDGDLLACGLEAYDQLLRDPAPAIDGDALIFGPSADLRRVRALGGAGGASGAGGGAALGLARPAGWPATCTARTGVPGNDCSFLLSSRQFWRGVTVPACAWYDGHLGSTGRAEGGMAALLADVIIVCVVGFLGVAGLSLTITGPPATPAFARRAPTSSNPQLRQDSKRPVPG
jgi:hypothetical protein